MSYTPPPYNAVNFDGSGAAYTPPPFGAVNFNDVPTVTSAIKTFNGIARASVKAWDGVALAAVKTWNGVA